MEAKHTPGPWETGALLTRVEVLPAGWRMPACVADCDTKHAPGTQEERVANARLIAAAPDLLKMLKTHPVPPDDADTEDGMAAYMDACEEWHALARAAIARATGGGK